MTNRTQPCQCRPQFVRVAMSPWRKGEPENHIMLNVANIESVTPPIEVSIRRFKPDGTTRTLTVTVPDPRYSISFRLGRRLEQGKVTAADRVRIFGWA